MKRHTKRHALPALTMVALAAGFFALAAPAQQTRDVPPILTRLHNEYRDWRITMELVLESEYLQNRNMGTRTASSIDLERAVVVMPVAPVTANAAPRTSAITGTLKGDRDVIDDTPRLLDGYQAGGRLIALDIKELQTNSLRMQTQWSMRCWETRIDEQRAFDLMWPPAPVEELYPEEALTALLPQRYIESDAPEIQELIFNWTGGDPHILRPYALAKTLAAKVIDQYMPVDDRYTTMRTDSYGHRYRVVLPVAGTYFGFRVEGAVAAATAQNHRGPVFDLPNLLCAVYRAAGIPARVVIGFDTRSETAPIEFPAITAWVEFYLWDTPNERGEWVPVDIIRQRAFASKAPPIAQKWMFFGRHEQSQWMCPLSVHWHPPTFVMSEGPALLWGWLPTPSDQRVVQRIRFHATSAGTRPDDEPFDGLE